MAKRACDGEDGAAREGIGGSEPTGVPGPSSKKSKREKSSPGLNRAYMNTKGQLFEDMQKIWKCRKQPFKCKSKFVSVVTEPFLCWTLKDFVDEGEGPGNGQGFVTELKNALMKLKFFDKNNDLYQFKQSHDLKEAKSVQIKQFRDVLLDDVLPWLRELTSIGLYETIDMTCAKYDYTDVLLCHDDELEGRRIAYIYYLVDTAWEEKDGGILDLFSTDEYGQPHQIVHSIVPLWNSFVFFEVTPTSFHQVSEVLTASKTRLSISGWFHGPSLPRPSPYKEMVPLMQCPLDKPLEVLVEWVNPVYLDVGTQSQIREQFENESQIELPDFLLEDKYTLLCHESVTCWEKRGPPNKRNTQIALTDKLSPLLIDCHTLFLSEPFCLLLSHLTGLQLTSYNLKLNPDDDTTSTATENGQNSSCSCRCDWYHWQHGNYTLMSDSSSAEMENENFSLDARLHFNTEEWMTEFGGYKTFVVKNEDEELLTLEPTPNSLQLVYKDDSDTLSFTKYINVRSTEESNGLLTWHSLEAVYQENNKID